jgi:DNA-binding transcriptional ArsR family regulator
MTSPQASFLALGDKNRLLLFRLLLTRPCSVGELTEISGLGQSLVSHHLAILARHGWIVAQRQGRRRIYRTAVAGSVLAPVARWIQRHLRLPDGWPELPVESGQVPRPGGGDMEDYLL